MGNGPAQPERQDDPTDPEDGQAAAPGAPHVLIVGTPDGSLRWLAAIPTRRKNYADGGIPAAFAGILMTDGYRRGYGTSLHGQSPASIAAGSRVTATSASTLSVPTSPLLSLHLQAVETIGDPIGTTWRTVGRKFNNSEDFDFESC